MALSISCKTDLNMTAPIRGAIAISYGGGDHTVSTDSGVANLSISSCRALYISTAGNLAVRLAGMTSDVTLTNLAAGTVYPFCVSIVRQTSSTAAGFFLF